MHPNESLKHYSHISTSKTTKSLEEAEADVSVFFMVILK